MKNKIYILILFISFSFVLSGCNRPSQEELNASFAAGMSKYDTINQKFNSEQYMSERSTNLTSEQLEALSKAEEEIRKRCLVDSTLATCQDIKAMYINENKITVRLRQPKRTVFFEERDEPKNGSNFYTAMARLR